MKKAVAIMLVLTLSSVLIGCGPSEPEQSAIPDTPHVTASTESTPLITESPEVTESPFIVPEHEIELVAKTLRGECYDDQYDDKREVVRVICNRVSDGWFGDSIEEVITKPRQFIGYKPDNIPTANDYEIAREILTQWYDGGCEPLSEYLFFSAGSGHKNVFRKDY